MSRRASLGFVELMVERRDVLRAALGALAAGIAPAIAAPQDPAPTPAAPAPAFSRDNVLELARSLAKKPFAAPANDLREPFAALSYEQYVGIKMKPGAAVWAGENKGFSFEPLHRGPIFTTPVELFIVEGGVTKRIAYDQAQFDYGGLKVPEKLPDMGFSGFRVLRAQNGGPEAEVAMFQGASFYRACAPGQNLGTSARGLSICTADPRGEEFPAFRIFWIEKPALGDNTLVIHALLDSQSVTGAYRFTLRPGEATIVDTELTLFPRVELDHIGIAGLAGASLYTPLDRRRTDDIRPAVAEMNGLQMLTGKDEWLWRPLSNRNNLQLSSFVDANPKGFGFLMRNRDISAYQDDEQHWERRPSLWIEPLGEWGEGSVQLVEIPSESGSKPEHNGLLAPQAALDGRQGDRFRLPPILVLGAAGASAHGLCDRRARRPRAGAQTPPLCRRFFRRSAWRPRARGDAQSGAHNLSRGRDEYSHLQQRANEDLPGGVRCRPWRRNLLRASARPTIGR